MKEKIAESKDARVVAGGNPNEVPEGEIISPELLINTGVYRLEVGKIPEAKEAFVGAI